MTFQFRCPDCQLLEADESDVGQTLVCPFCGRELEVPAPPESQEPVLPQIHRRGSVTVDIEEPVVSTPNKGPIEVEDPDTYHIACPRGFLMEVPHEMLGQHALCPCCQSQVVLNLRDSIEFKKKRALEEKIEDTRLGKFWLNLAIVVVVLVLCGLGLIGLIEVFSER